MYKKINNRKTLIKQIAIHNKKNRLKIKFTYGRKLS